MYDVSKICHIHCRTLKNTQLGTVWFTFPGEKQEIEKRDRGEVK